MQQCFRAHGNVEAILQSACGNECDPNVQELLAEHLSLDVKSMPCKVETSLCWKDGRGKLAGSERTTFAILQSDSLMISKDAFHCPDQLVSDLLIAFRQIPPLLRYLKPREVEVPLKQVLKLAFSEGPAGIPEVLRTNKIESELEKRICLGIGDRLPDELRANLNYSMNVVFEAGPLAVVGIFNSPDHFLCSKKTGFLKCGKCKCTY